MSIFSKHKYNNLFYLTKHFLPLHVKSINTIRIFNNSMDIPLPQSLNSNPNSEACQSALSYDNSNIIIIICCALSLLWAIYNFLMVRRIDLQQQPQQDGESGEEQLRNDDYTADQKRTLLQLSYKISDASMQFIKHQYAYCLVVLVLMFVAVFFLTDKGPTTSISLLVGGVVNMISSFLALYIATQSNYRIAYSSKYGTGETFRNTYKACCAIGFGVSSFITLCLAILIDVIIAQSNLQTSNPNHEYFLDLFEAVAGYALGTSIVSIFTRVSGGVFTASAEVGAQLFGKVQGGIPYLSPRNPATVTENAGQIIGQLLGSVSEFSTSLTETACVVFILSCSSLTGYAPDVPTCNYFIGNFMYPLMGISLGLFFSIVVSLIATNFIWVQSVHQTQLIMRVQLALITVVMLGALYLAAFMTFPSQFTLTNIYERYYDVQQQWVPYLCSAIGLLTVLLLSLFNQFFSDPAYFPVQSLIQSSRSSSAANLANGLALGYISTILPIILIAVAVYFSNMFLSFYGIGLAAIGAISGFPLFLASSVFSPLAENSHQMAKLADLGAQPREKTEEMVQAGQSASARSRAFAIHPAALAGMALFGGFLFNCNMHQISSQDFISITQPLIFTGVLLGAMIPFLISGIILPAVQKSSAQLVDNVNVQLREDEGILQGNTQPDYASSAGVVASSSFKYSLAPILITLLAPLAIGFGLGRRVVAGYLIGLIVSGIQFSLSGVISAQVWKNAKKMIQSGSVSDEDGKVIARGTDCHKASLIGRQVGSSLENTASISFGAIIKLSGIVSVVFAGEMTSVRG